MFFITKWASGHKISLQNTLLHQTCCWLFCREQLIMEISSSAAFIPGHGAVPNTRWSSASGTTATAVLLPFTMQRIHSKAFLMWPPWAGLQMEKILRPAAGVPCWGPPAATLLSRAGGSWVVQRIHAAWEQVRFLKINVCTFRKKNKRCGNAVSGVLSGNAMHGALSTVERSRSQTQKDVWIWRQQHSSSVHWKHVHPFVISTAQAQTARDKLAQPTTHLSISGWQSSVAQCCAGRHSAGNQPGNPTLLT